MSKNDAQMSQTEENLFNLCLCEFLFVHLAVDLWKIQPSTYILELVLVTLATFFYSRKYSGTFVLMLTVCLALLMMYMEVDGFPFRLPLNDFRKVVITQLVNMAYLHRSGLSPMEYFEFGFGRNVLGLVGMFFFLIYAATIF